MTVSCFIQQHSDGRLLPDSPILNHRIPPGTAAGPLNRKGGADGPQSAGATVPGLDFSPITPVHRGQLSNCLYYDQGKMSQKDVTF